MDLDERFAVLNAGARSLGIPFVVVVIVVVIVVVVVVVIIVVVVVIGS
jgi:hypothetical protein